jgi:hypothetical protein
MSAATASVAVLPTVSATPSGAKVEGVVYDPVTHEVLGEASGQYNHVHDDLRGNLRFDIDDSLRERLGMHDEKINMSRFDRQADGEVEGLQKRVYGFSETDRDSEPMAIRRLSTVGESIVGYVQNGETQVAYSMLPKQRSQRSLDQLLEDTGFPEDEVSGRSGGGE